MHTLDDEERRRLLDHFMAYEPTIRVNDITYHVHVKEKPESLLFYALLLRMQQVRGAVTVPREFYETANNGLVMAWLTTTVLDDLERSIQSGEVRLSLQDFNGDNFSRRDD